MTIGIYAIVNREISKVYIGKSKHIEQRWLEHIKCLNAHTHHNKELQADWYRYGEGVFTFNILQVCSEFEIDILEKELIARYREQSLYNYNYKRHPWSLININGNSSSTKYVKDEEGDVLPVKHCPNCDLDKLANSFFNSIYCYECLSSFESELQEEVDIIESISLLTGDREVKEGKPVFKYKLL